MDVISENVEINLTSSGDNNVKCNTHSVTKLKQMNKKRKHKLIYETKYRENMRKNVDQECDAKELELENLVFGGETDILEQLESQSILKKKTRKKKGKETVFDSEVPYVVDNLGVQQIDEEKSDKISNEVKRTQQVWVDEDDDKILIKDKISTYRKCHRSVAGRSMQKYEDYAREMFVKANGMPNWAKLETDKGSDSDVESDEELLKKTGNYIAKSKTLLKGIIDVRKCADITKQDSKHTVLKSVEFHPSSRVSLIAGLDGRATLNQVDGKTNSEIQSIYFGRFPIYTAHFTKDGNEFIVGSAICGYYFSYDMIRGEISKIPWEKGMEQNNVRRFHMSPDGKMIAIHGRYGNIHLVSSKSKEWIDSLKMNGEIVASAFNQDGSRMFTHGTGGQVYIWDMSTRQCINKFTDEGSIIGCSLAISPNGQYLATGSDSGVVNIYDHNTIQTSSNPKPLKAIMNLRTEITNLKFNCTSEILAMASSFNKDAVKMVHFPSMSVFSNFPSRIKTINHVNSLDISPNSGYLMMGNNGGKVYLHRLRHYANY